MGDTISKLQATMSKLLSAIQASIQTHKWWWAGGGGAAVVAIAAVVVVFGGFFGPSGKAICTIALGHARDYGVVPNSAILANTDAKSTDVKDRKVCTAQAYGADYQLTVDVTCKDMKKKDCVSLYSVQRADGLSTYQVRQVPDDDTDATADAGSTAPSGAAPGAADTQGAASGAVEDSDIQTTTGTHGSDTNQQANPQQ